MPSAFHPQLSHCGVYARDVSKMVDFYTDIVGLVVSDRGISSRGGELAFITDRHVPQSRVGARVAPEIEQGLDRALQLGPAREQRIVIDRQRAECGDRLDDPDRRVRTDDRIETQHALTQPPVDAVAELDDESVVASRQETQFHLFPW